MKYLLYSLIILLFGSLYLYGCANRSVPTGGPKDTIPPSLTTVVPAHKSLNYRGNKMVLQFDEFIKTKDITNQLIITPRLTEEYESKINKYTLTIDFNQALDSNTTYTFNFQEAVQDINESTPARDLVVAFSTGDYIDSLSIEGKVRHLLNNKPAENAVVALYQANDTLDLFNSKPQYFTKTKEDGSYKLENLKNASYRLYAFIDKNKNLTAQSDAEPHGFVPDTIHLDTSIISLDIPLMQRNVKEFTLQSARPNGKYYELKLNKFVEDYNFEILEDHPDTLISNRLKDGSTIRIYNTFTKDSVVAVVNAIDTIGQKLIDTVAIKFPPTQRNSDPISHEITPKTASAIEEDYVATISFSKPIKVVNLDSTFFYYDSLTIDTIKQSEISWNKFRDKVTIRKRLDKQILEKEPVPLAITDSTAQENTATENLQNSGEINKENRSPGKPELKSPGKKGERGSAPPPVRDKFEKKDKEVLLFLGEGTFYSIENDTLPRISAVYSFKNNKDMGLIKGTINTENESFFIQLLNNSFEVIKEIEGAKIFRFDLVPPGEYNLRFLVDNNGDGKWNPGNILQNEPPEEVYFYTEPVIIRANWERELDEIEF